MCVPVFARGILAIKTIALLFPLRGPLVSKIQLICCHMGRQHTETARARQRTRQWAMTIAILYTLQQYDKYALARIVIAFLFTHLASYLLVFCRFLLIHTAFTALTIYFKAWPHTESSNRWLAITSSKRRNRFSASSVNAACVA